MKTAIIVCALMILAGCVAPVYGQSKTIYSHITSASGLGDDHALHIEQLPDKRMLAVTHRTLNIYDGGTFRVIPRDDEKVFMLPHYTNGYALGLDADNIMWVKEWGRMWCVDMNTETLISDYSALFGKHIPMAQGNPIDVFFEPLPRDDEGTTAATLSGRHVSLWFLTAKGLWSAADMRFYPVTKADGIVEMHVTSSRLHLFRRDGSMVILNRNTGEREAVVPTPCASTSDLWGMYVLPIDSCRLCCVFSSRESFVKMINLNSLSWSSLADCKMVLYGAFRLDSNSIGVGSRHGIVKVHMHSGNFCQPQWEMISTFVTEERTYTDIVINDACHDHQGGLWIATDALGLLYTHPLRNKFRSSHDFMSLDISPRDAERVHRRLVKVYDATKQYDHDWLADRAGRIWHATHKGINIVSSTDSLWLTTADGLPGNHVISLALDAKGHVWAATNKGVAEIAADDNGQFIVTPYGTDDGVPQWSFLYSSSLMLGDGRIALQAQQGWVAFHPDSVKHPLRRLVPRLVGVTVNNVDTVLVNKDNMRLRYQQNNVSLTFSTFDYAFPRQVGYRWRINRGEWQNGTPLTDSRGLLRLTLMQLAPGKYDIEVLATSDGRTFSTSPLRFVLTVTPPWWKTWWAYSIYIAMSLAILFVIAMLYFIQQRNRLEWKRQEEVLQLQIRHLLEQAAPANDEQVDNEGEEKAELAEMADEDPLDNEFIQRVVALIEQHLGDDYSVEQLASDLCMERTGLYKRLTSLIDQTPQRFIRSIRIRRACDLLATTDLPITEVCYRVGFSSSSYMSRCFVEDLGCKPGEWRTRHKEQG